MMRSVRIKRNGFVQNLYSKARLCDHHLHCGPSATLNSCKASYMFLYFLLCVSQFSTRRTLAKHHGITKHIHRNPSHKIPLKGHWRHKAGVEAPVSQTESVHPKIRKRQFKVTVNTQRMIRSRSEVGLGRNLTSSPKLQEWPKPSLSILRKTLWLPIPCRSRFISVV